MIGQQGKQYQVAIYCRLSRDDGNLTESSSISTQREILTRYVREQGWKIAGEYIDDGYSGVNFDRPDFKRMLSDIELGKINCVITKDLSRFGRNYLEAGVYIEIFFPERGIRYIALNDGVDTFETANSSMDITPFKNLLNEMYSRDQSKKVKAAKKARLLQGKFMGTSAPYGYKKDPADKNHLVIDKETAPVVKRIFELAKQGLGVRRIRNILSDERILRPGATTWKDNGNYAYFFSDDKEKIYVWERSSVRDILRDPVYLGHLAGCKHISITMKSKKRLHVPQEDWIVVKHTHEAIVSQEDFDLVQRLIVSRRRSKIDNSSYDNVFVGIVRCADCNYTMSARTENRRHHPEAIDNAFYICNRYNTFGKTACTYHKIEARDLHNAVLKDIQEHAKIAIKDDKELLNRIIQKLYKSKKMGFTAMQKELQQIKMRLSELDRLFAKLYEDRIERKISEWNYDSLSKRYEDEQRQLRERIDFLNSQQEERKAVNDNAKLWISKIKEYARIEQLTAPMLNELIDCIKISDVKKLDGVRYQSVNIYYKFIGCISEAEQT